MKKIMIMAVAVLALTACGGNNNKHQNHGTHVHEDGTVHQDHATETPATQETFKVEADTTSAEAELHHDHEHSHGHDLMCAPFVGRFYFLYDFEVVVLSRRSTLGLSCTAC